MSDVTNRFKQLLVSNGQNVTKARVRTFGLLLGQGPQSMNELIARAGQSVDRVSIYRNIELFERLGIVKKIHIGWKYKVELSDIFTNHHHHLVCLKCGRIIDIEDEQHIESFIHEVAKKHGFAVRGHQFEVEGYCSQCAAETK